MDLEQKYQKAYDSLEDVIGKRIHTNSYMAMGYTSNLDLLCKFRVERLNRLLEKYIPQGSLAEMTTVPVIKTMEEFLSTIVYYGSRGIGGEADVENMEIVKESFEYTNGMGGTAVQAAMALAEMGCPSLVHLTDDSKEVCEILDSPSIYTISRDGELVHTDKIIQTQEQEVHYIIQFKKGDKIRLGSQTAEIPCSNRLILTKVTVNEFVPFSKPYFEWVERNAVHVKSNVLSSFNTVLEPGILKERLDYVRKHIEKYRRNNPDGVVFFEEAHYHDSEVRKLCLETIYPCADIVSLNEEELKAALNGIYHFDVDIHNILSCIEGMKFIKEESRIRKGVIVHTKDYSMYVGDRLKADIETGLIYGNMLATAKACNGWYGSKKDVEGILGLPLSPKGLENYHTVKESNYAPETVLVPTKYMDRPKYTIGLGDCFVGGIQMCF